MPGDEKREKKNVLMLDMVKKFAKAIMRNARL